MNWLNRIMPIARHNRIECRHCGAFNAKGEACRCVQSVQGEIAEKAQERLIGDLKHCRAIIQQRDDTIELLGKTHEQTARRLQQRCERIANEQATYSNRKHSRAMATIDELRATVAALQSAAQ